MPVVGGCVAGGVSDCVVVRPLLRPISVGRQLAGASYSNAGIIGMGSSEGCTHTIRRCRAHTSCNTCTASRCE